MKVETRKSIAKRTAVVLGLLLLVAANQDIAQGVAVYGPEEYVVGLTWGAFSGNVNKGQDDIFVTRYDHDGNTVWYRQLGSSDSDEARAVAVNQGGVYVVGEAGGVLPGNTDKGGIDAFVVKYNHAGDVLWSKQFGTNDIDGAHGVGVDATGVYVADTTFGAFQGGRNAGFSDVFVRKYSFQGDVLWTDQFGSPTVRGRWRDWARWLTSPVVRTAPSPARPAKAISMPSCASTTRNTAETEDRENYRGAV